MKIDKPITQISLQFLGNLKTSIKKIELDFLGEYLDTSTGSFDSQSIQNKEEIYKLNNRVRGYCLLAHAEIQGFLEFLSKEYVKYSYQIYEKNQIITELLVFFATYQEYNFPNGGNFDIGSTNQSLNDFGTFPSRYNKISEKFLGVIKENNGIKTKDLVKIFYPLGIELDEILKMQCTPILESFGTKRGNFAHQPYHSIFKTSTTISNPEDFIKDVNIILDSIEKDLIPRLNKLVKINRSSLKYKGKLAHKNKALK